MMLNRVCINSLLNEFLKIAFIASPNQQLAKAVMPSKHLPINIAQKPPLPQLGSLGKLPNTPTVSSGLNTSAIARTNSAAPNAPATKAMTGNIKSLVN